MRVVLILQFLLLICMQQSQSNAARILGIFPFPGKSHMITFSALTHALAERGHELVVISTFPSKNPPGNYTDISTWDSLKDLYKGLVINADIFSFEDNVSKPMMPLLFYWKAGCITIELTLKDPNVKKLLDDKKGFDLVIAEDFMSDATFGFAHYFKAPLILISSFGGFHYSNYAVGNPFNSAHTVNNILEYSDRKDFWERTVNTLFTWYWDIGAEFLYHPRQQKYMDDFFGPGLPPVKQLRKSASLVLVNNHFSLNYPRPLVPSFVEVGGLHVKPSNKPLPKDIKNWLDGAKDGVIYFSMGSNLRANLLPVEKRTAFLEAFATLKQRVLWKWESETLPGKPDNLMISQWVPQMEVLSHPNVKLFITHGGLLSGQEAMYNGVPVMGIPIFGDQRMNVGRAAKEGYGVLLSFNNITKESILSAINKGLNDNKIRTEVKRRQKVYLDQPETPLERAIFWTEYILRHDGAPHLRSAALDLTWYQLELLDVYLFLFSITFGTLIVFTWCVKIICCRSKAGKKVAFSDAKTKKLQ